MRTPVRTTSCLHKIDSLLHIHINKSMYSCPGTGTQRTLQRQLSKHFREWRGSRLLFRYSESSVYSIDKCLKITSGRGSRTRPTKLGLECWPFPSNIIDSGNYELISLGTSPREVTMSLLTRPIGLHHSVSQGGHILITVVCRRTSIQSIYITIYNN